MAGSSSVGFDEDALPLVGHVGESDRAVAESGAGGLVAGEHEQVEQVAELAVRQSVAVGLGLHELGHDVVAGVGLALLLGAARRTRTGRGWPGC